MYFMKIRMYLGPYLGKLWLDPRRPDPVPSPPSLLGRPRPPGWRPAGGPPPSSTPPATPWQIRPTKTEIKDMNRNFLPRYN